MAILAICVSTSEIAGDNERVIFERTVVAAASARLLVIHHEWVSVDLCKY